MSINPNPGQSNPDIPIPAREVSRLYRRKPLLVSASPQPDSSWLVLEGGREIRVSAVEFEGLYEMVEIDPMTAVDAGMPDMEPGTRIDRDGRRLVRVTVIGGRGPVAYWHNGKPRGEFCGFRAIADNMDNIQAPHRIGRFLEGFEGKAMDRAWVVMGESK